jgi:hypothetical protein
MYMKVVTMCGAKQLAGSTATPAECLSVCATQLVSTVLLARKPFMAWLRRLRSSPTTDVRFDQSTPHKLGISRLMVSQWLLGEIPAAEEVKYRAWIEDVEPQRIRSGMYFTGARSYSDRPRC